MGTKAIKIQFCCYTMACSQRAQQQPSNIIYIYSRAQPQQRHSLHVGLIMHWEINTKWWLEKSQQLLLHNTHTPIQIWTSFAYRHAPHLNTEANKQELIEREKKKSIVSAVIHGVYIYVKEYSRVERHVINFNVF